MTRTAFGLLLGAHAVALAVLACVPACASGLPANDPHKAQVDACAVLAEEAFEDGASVYEATKQFDACVARIPR